MKNRKRTLTNIVHICYTAKFFFGWVVTKTYPPYIEIDKIPPGGEGIPYIYVWVCRGYNVDIALWGIPTRYLPPVCSWPPTPHALCRVIWKPGCKKDFFIQIKFVSHELCELCMLCVLYPLNRVMNAVAQNIRIDLEKIDSNNSQDLIKMQTKLNQWITAGTLVKFDKDVLPDGKILFTICRLKPTGE